MKDTYASTSGPGYGSNLSYRADSFTDKMIAGMKRTRMNPTLAQNPFCNILHIQIIHFSLYNIDNSINKLLSIKKH